MGTVSIGELTMIDKAMKRMNVLVHIFGYWQRNEDMFTVNARLNGSNNKIVMKISGLVHMCVGVEMVQLCVVRQYGE